MPHFVLEYSANLDDALDVPGLFVTLHEAALATGMFPPGGIRFRAHRCEHYLVADGDPANAFVHLAAMVGAGRDLDTRRAAAGRVFEALTGALDALYAERPLAISFEMRELDAVLNYKRNNLHEYLQARAGGD